MPGQSQESFTNGEEDDSRSRTQAERGPRKRGRVSDFEYDPAQDPVKKRELRREYRELIAQTEETKRNLAAHKPEDLKRLIQRGDDLYGKVVAPTEGVLDSRSLLNMSEIGAQMARAMKMDVDAFDVEEYLSRLARWIGGSSRASGGIMNHGDDDDEEGQGCNDWDWDKLGRLAAKYSRRAPTMDFLLGPLQVEQKTRKAVTRQRLDRNAVAEVAPQQLREEDIQRSENETTLLVRNIAQLLDQSGGEEGVNLFRFAINPKSFSNTVENLFYISFLVRDGRVMLKDDENGDPILVPTEPATEEDYQSGVTRRQLVMELDMETWKGLIQSYDIKESIIPTRTNSSNGPMRARSGWYG
ncbi:hypothetical protein IE53DRAFT_321835 [Violaceomyces palustris]|uniref:Uncharacterized protein n=1 Tax=Violaceomyces palustris TaxID=1673888 RepID=A0ACD0NMU1_9BASI|nr:hypothetical protein IE53DRAFT_321835 [Violaceomyces palustris]